MLFYIRIFLLIPFSTLIPFADAKSVFPNTCLSLQYLFHCNSVVQVRILTLGLSRRFSEHSCLIETSGQHLHVLSELKYYKVTPHPSSTYFPGL